MKTYRSALLAGAAALALVAGTAFASAQDQGKNRTATPQAGPSHTIQPGGAQGSGAKMGAKGNVSPTAQNGSGGAMNGKGSTQPQTQAQQGGKGGPAGAMEGKTPGNRHAERVNRGHKTGRGRTAERQRVLHGLQGNATGQPQGGTTTEHGSANAGGSNAGANVKLSERQRTDIRKTIIDRRGAPRVGRVDFNVSVGTVIPRGRVHIVPVPETLVRIEPEWRGFLYFVYEDELVVVNPRDMRIVAVLAV